MRTTDVQQFEDGSQVPPPTGFAPFAGGGPPVVIPDTTNLLAGDGSGGVDDSDIAISAVATVGNDLGSNVSGAIVTSVGNQTILVDTSNPNVSFLQTTAAFSFGVGAPSGDINAEFGVYINCIGTPGTALAPGNLIYQTTNAGASWAAIL